MRKGKPGALRRPLLPGRKYLSLRKLVAGLGHPGLGPHSREGVGRRETGLWRGSVEPTAKPEGTGAWGGHTPVRSEAA